MRFSLRQTMWHGLLSPSLLIPSVKRSGNQSTVFTSIAAPEVEILWTVQGITSLPNSIVPAFNTRLRGAARCSSITTQLPVSAAIVPMVKQDPDGWLTATTGGSSQGELALRNVKTRLATVED